MIQEQNLLIRDPQKGSNAMERRSFFARLGLLAMSSVQLTAGCRGKQYAHVLKEGDAIQFDAVLSHTYRALSDCRILTLHIRKGKQI